MASKKVTAALVAAVFAITGLNYQVTNSTVKAQAKEIIKAYVKGTDSAAVSSGIFKSGKFKYVMVKDSAGKDIRAHQPAEVDWRPLEYTTADRVYRVIVQDSATDSTIFVGHVQSDSVGLFHLQARIQPSKPPSEPPPDTTGE